MSWVPQKPGHGRHTCARLWGCAQVQLIQLQEDALWDRQRLASCQEDFRGWSPWWWFSWGDELLQRKVIRISNSMEVRSRLLLGLNSRAFHFEISCGPAPKSRQSYNVSSINASRDPTTKSLKDITQWQKYKPGNQFKEDIIYLFLLSGACFGFSLHWDQGSEDSALVININLY